MAVRVGVDVGGTFTKAVACEADSGEIVCRAVVPTTHASPLGIAEGVVRALDEVLGAVERAGAGPVLLVAHSTTQAVNALLEGDTATVGVIGIGRAPDLRRARRRTTIGDVRVAPGRTLRTLHSFLDGTRRPSRADLKAAALGLVERGASALCVSEAFGIQDPKAERLGLAIAKELGIPACAGNELTGLHGLELRTVTAAVNASILPAALRTARVVEEAVAERLPSAPLLVMRGDGGAADISFMRRWPLLTAFSGPAASVAGALRHLNLRDAVVIEVGGTSTSVSVVRGGRPVLSHVRVLEHVTSVRGLDVRVLGVAGGSMLRVSRRMGRLRLAGIGPRSAHIAGLPYCSFSHAEDLVGAQARLVAPREGDPAEYAALETPDGRRYALTLTCAANALERVPEDTYARGEAGAARVGFEAIARLLGDDWRWLAEEALRTAARVASASLAELVGEYRLARPVVVGLGGGAGALVPAAAAQLGLEWTIPPDAMVISSVGDALSLVRVELERDVERGTVEALASLVAEVEEAAVVSGADPESLRVETEAVPERGALRAVALAAVALPSASPGDPMGDEALSPIAREALREEPVHLAATPGYSVFATPRGLALRFVVLDRRGAIAASGEGTVLVGTGEQVAVKLKEELRLLTRHLGPFSAATAVRIVRGHRLVDLSVLSSPAQAVRAAQLACSLADGQPVVALISRQ